MGDNGRQREQRKARRETMGDKDTYGETMEGNWRRGETRPWEGGHTIQHRHTCGERMGDKGRQDLGKAGTPTNTGTHVGRQWGTTGGKGRQDLGKAEALSMGDSRRQDLGKADTPSNKGNKKETRGDKTSGRRTHHPTPRRTP